MQPHPDLTDDLLDEFREMLTDDIARLDRHLAHLEANGTVELDQSAVGRLSRMDALMNQGLGQATDRRAVTDRQDAIDALGRIDDGSYGICSGCHEPIPVARLEAMPETRHCTSCG
jgi:DnaK suppressor protein